MVYSEALRGRVAQGRMIFLEGCKEPKVARQYGTSKGTGDHILLVAQTTRNEPVNAVKS